ncbi:UNVERIFIED_CONTAM: Retrovirus-related Pol polyprotein from type-2 retrotransposable element R2DM [Sesamum radiatum]|uniref:Retrovirus-related Pol polyprotein from type-2 retrotransposable element R2DM n=1 Tax=Sesamum radiatum TaxID=300843 RepID=A0AAW2IL19_SESRA
MAWLKDGDQCSRIFFRKVAKRRASKRVFQINTTDGRTLTSQPERNLPPRCALKVDLRKAYDTVEWDFLKAALTLFGFPEQFIQWIAECVTTPSYSLTHGFFRGARGLRQGDPMSPFLFVLVMEVLTLILRQRIEQNGGFSYHWRCEAVQLFQLSFADDLLFSKAEPNSIQLFKDGLMDFAELSGLQANLQKSHLILSRSAAASRDSLLAILDFQEGHLPLRYLGLPLLASRLSISDCQPILRKIEARIKGWEGVMLSFAGRVQLIKSVLSATGYAKVSWQQVCRPVNEGGLGIRDIHSLNKGLMSRHLWRIISHDSNSIWVSWIFHYRLQNSSVWTIRTRKGTWGWRKLIRLRDALRPHVVYQIGDGTSFSLWHDPWHPRGPLLPQFPLGPRHTFIPSSAPLSTVISEDTWSWPHITDMESIDITHDLPTIHGGQDRILWTGPRGSFSSAAAYDLFRPPGPTVDWTSLLVGTFRIPRHRFILWLAVQGRLSTTDKPWLQHLGSGCVLCQDGIPESHEHLFFMCSFASECIRAIRREVSFIGHIITGHQSFVGHRHVGAGTRGECCIQGTLRVACLPSVAGAQLSGLSAYLTPYREDIVRIVVSEIRDLIICKQLPRTVSTRGLYRLWRIPWPVEGVAHT